MSTIDREVAWRLNDASQAVLNNRDKDKHPALQARYEAYREIADFLTEQRKADNNGDEPLNAEE